jgi:carbon monoxide dehydrogenase subunit G
MKARVKTQTVIAAKPSAVFKYLSHTKYHKLWNQPIQSIEPIAQLESGSEYVTVVHILGVRNKAMNHVTKYKQDDEIQIENKTGMLQYSVNYRLSPEKGGTKLTCTTSVAATGKAFAFARPLLEHLARRELNTDLKALKHAVENGVEPA